MIHVYINTVLCAALFYTCFCRLVRTSSQTEIGVRVAFCILAGSSAFVLVSPFWIGCTPSGPQLVIEGAMVIVQGLTARYWQDGVPCHFQKRAWSDTQAENRNEVHP